MSAIDPTPETTGGEQAFLTGTSSQAELEQEAFGIVAGPGTVEDRQARLHELLLTITDPEVQDVVGQYEELIMEEGPTKEVPGESGVTQGTFSEPSKENT